MKISEIRVDGYGVFGGVSIDDLPPGLTVVHGANEAGKSTLLDFIRGILFGFPDRRHRAPFHEPLRGGRHGGALRLIDEDERAFLLERHVDARHPVLTGPNGELVDEARLAALLGGADEALYRAVFAFGLGELMAFESLDRDEVRDVVFSAGVLGAGRSATRAGRSLEQRRGEIVRPRRQGARANQLQRRLEELDGELRAARRAAEGYAAARAECEQLAARVRAARQLADALGHRAAELERISICWPVHLRRAEAAARLADLGPLTRRELDLIGRASDIKNLATAVSGHEERVQQRAERSVQLASIETRLSTLCHRLDLAPGLLPPAPSIAAIERARHLADEHAAQLAATAALRDETERAAREHDEATALLTATVASNSARDSDVLTALSLDLGELRRLLRERDQRDAERLQDDREQRLALLAAPAHPRFDRQPAMLLIVAALVLGAVATSVASRSLHAASVVLASLALVLIAVLAARVLRTPSSRTTDTATATTSEQPSDRAGAARAATPEARIAQLTAACGLAADATLGTVESMVERLDLERANRREVDDLERRVDEAWARYSDATARQRAAARHIAAYEEQSREAAVRLGLAPLDPTPLVDALDALGTAHDLVAARARLLSGIETLNAQIAGFTGLLVATEAACDTDRISGEGVGLDRGDGDLAPRIAVLVADLESAIARRTESGELSTTITDADEFLVNSLGTGPAAERLRNELRDGDVLAWKVEREHLDETAKESEVAYEAVRDELREAERALADLMGSDEIARLEIERQGCAAALDEALSEWLMLGVARSLLERTLARYERERQPRVIALAGDLFEEVTDGRYVALVARDDLDASTRRGIEVIGHSGTRVSASDLSRGTAEQLYLCLRLAFATTFAEQAAPLPLVLDDVLVNFDPRRAASVARAVVRTAATHQVLAFTCHPHVAEHFAAADPTLRVVELDAGN